MTPLPDRARVVVVGGGITGTSVAYHLTELGWRDVVVLDRGPFPRTGSSTSHAPGLMFLHNNSQIMARLAQYSADLYESFEWEDLPCYFRVGGVEVATNPARLEELKRKAGQMRSWGGDAWMLSPEEAQKHVPMLDPSRILGAVFFPKDGVTRAVRTVSALADKASSQGASFHGEQEVTGFDITDGRVHGVRTSDGSIECEAVVLASGYWGPLVGALAGVAVPLRPFQHQYTKTVPLERYRGAAECIEPILRFQDMDMYFRQDGEVYGLGSYWHEPRMLEPEEVPTKAFSENGVSVLPFQEDDWAVPYAAALELLPELKGVELPYRINGLLSWTPDGNPVIGESREVRGFWLAEAVWVTHGGGTGKMVAELMTSGTTEWDVHEIDLYRFHDHVYAPDFIRQRGSQGYREAYDVIHPNYQAVHQRGLRRSPFYEAEEELGAEFFDTAGWERPQWYEANQPLLDLFPVEERHGWNANGWSPIEGAEHLAVRSRVGAFDISAFTKLVISGPGALAALERLCANKIDRPIGRMTYTSMLDENGGIVCDLTITRLGPDRFWVVTGGAVGPHDLHWIRSHVPDDGSVHISDVTSSRAAVGLWGPRSRALLQKLTEEDVSNEAFPYLTSGELSIGGVLTGALRISYAGELGWELYVPMEMGQLFWERLIEAGEEFGLVVAGAGAFDSLRLEKGYRGWGTDIQTDYNPYEAGLGFAVRMNKGDFIGRTALERIKAEGIKRKLCCVTIDDGQVVMGKEPIIDGDSVLGYVTSANYGYSVAKSIAYGYLPIEKSEPGTKVEITYFDERHPATVTSEPLFDSTNSRLTH